jgi:hypothetical protein
MNMLVRDSKSSCKQLLAASPFDMTACYRCLLSASPAKQILILIAAKISLCVSCQLQHP